MTTFERHVKRASLVAAVITVAIASVGAQGQAPPPANKTPERPAARGLGRGDAAPGEFSIQAVQDALDGMVLIEAERELGLTGEQYPDFFAKMRRIQNVRRRHTMERTRMFRELNAMTFANPKPDDAALTEKLKTFDQLNERSAQEMRQLAQELEGILTPYQRVRFRLFEERMERRKIDMLARARAGRAGGGGGNPPAQSPAAPGKGRGGQ